jgi:hypothetical protein
MFAKLQSLALKVVKSRPCPSCREIVQPQVGAGATVGTCPACGTSASLLEWLSGQNDDEGWADPDIQPAGSGIVRRELELGTLAWEIPPTGKSHGLMLFSIIWLGFLVFMTGAGAVEAAKSGDLGAWLTLVFLLPFWAAGLGIGYVALRGKFAKHLLVVSPSEVILVRSLFQRMSRKTLAREAVSGVARVVVYTVNDKPVHGVEVTATNGRLRFGGALSEEEKLWLVADIRRALGFGGERSESAKPPSAATGGSTQPFAIELATAQNLVAPGIILAGSLFFVALGVWVIPHDDFFHFAWTAFSSVFACITALAVVRALASRGTTVRIEANGQQLLLLRLKHGREQSRQTVPRADVRSVRCFRQGDVNGQPIGRLEIILHDKPITLVSWRKLAEIQGPAADLSAHLGLN